MTLPKWSLLLFAGWVAALPASAQGIQSTECVFLGGPRWVGAQQFPGSDLVFSGNTGYVFAGGCAYQVARFSAAGLWIEMTPATFSAGLMFARTRDFVDTQFAVYVPTARLMVPVASRLSIYGAAGFGAGWFNYPVTSGGSTPSITSNSTWHGVFVYGGGVDYRLNRWISIRAETRDYVTGRGLSGSAGRHHPIPLAGFALHF